MGTLLAPIGAVFHVIFYEPVYNLLMLMYQGTHSFALAVVLVTLLLRVALIPLTRKQLKSSREMQVLQPKLKELQQQYRNDPQRLMQEQRALYKEHGVSPLSGCLPLLIQMPVLYALYFAFYTVLPLDLHKINVDIYPFLPHLTAVPNLHFLWMNLAHPDPLHILPVIAAVLTFVQLRMAMPVRKPHAAGAPRDATSQATGMMQWIMPVMTLFIGLNFYSGLCLYWAISTGFSGAQQYFINGRNWGSLFLGIPGMEHLVPAPKDTPAAATLGAGRGAGATGRALPAGTSAVAPARGGLGGGFGALFRQMREAATAQAAMTDRAAKPSEKDVVEADSSPPERAGKTQSTSERRPRSPKSGALLVKPAMPALDATEGGEAAEEMDATAQAIQEATDTTTLPEQAMRQAGAPVKATNGTGANGTGANGTGQVNGKVNGKAAQNGQQNGQTSRNGTARPATSQRKPAAKGQSAARARNNRPKGGR